MSQKQEGIITIYKINIIHYDLSFTASIHRVCFINAIIKKQSDKDIYK